MSTLLVYAATYLALGYAVMLFAHFRYARVEPNDGALFFVLVLLWPMVFALLTYRWFTRAWQRRRTS